MPVDLVWVLTLPDDRKTILQIHKYAKVFEASNLLANELEILLGYYLQLKNKKKDKQFGGAFILAR